MRPFLAEATPNHQAKKKFKAISLVKSRSLFGINVALNKQWQKLLLNPRWRKTKYSSATPHLLHQLPGHLDRIELVVVHLAVLLELFPPVTLFRRQQREVLLVCARLRHPPRSGALVSVRCDSENLKQQLLLRRRTSPCQIAWRAE